MDISGRIPGIARASKVFPVPARPSKAHYAQKTVAFHFEFGSEISANTRYKMQSMFSMKNLQLANEALGRT